jgi:hypothetical protein
MYQCYRTLNHTKQNICVIHIIYNNFYSVMSSIIKQLLVCLHIIPDEPLSILYKEWCNYGAYSNEVKSQLLQRADKFVKDAEYVRECIINGDPEWCF